MAKADIARRPQKYDARPGARIARGLTVAPFIGMPAVLIVVVLSPRTLFHFLLWLKALPLAVVVAGGALLLVLHAYAILNYFLVYRSLQAVGCLDEVRFLVGSVAWPCIVHAAWWHCLTHEHRAVADADTASLLVGFVAALVAFAFWRLSAPEANEPDGPDHEPVHEAAAITGGACTDAEFHRFAAALAATGITGADLVEHLCERGLSREAAKRVANEVR